MDGQEGKEHLTISSNNSKLAPAPSSFSSQPPATQFHDLRLSPFVPIIDIVSLH
jgi:hypothetical protein